MNAQTKAPLAGEAINQITNMSDCMTKIVLFQPLSNLDNLQMNIRGSVGGRCDLKGGRAYRRAFAALAKREAKRQGVGS